ncbi:MAG: glutamine--fructose-6-phosphate aminotransferase, partial [Dehalococcoidia bacterium]
MCGIVGYTGYRDALPVLLSSLERVTYRGYDSFGVALLNGSGIELVKKIGTVEGDHVELNGVHGSLGIGHTRWATVGGVSNANAHPHPDCTGELAIVHNGDIDNFHILRQRLQSQGHQFSSQTDSEVIAHLIESYCASYGVGEADIVAATSRAIDDLEGPFAIAVLHRPSRQLVVARRESPLVVGLGEGEAFVASDVPAILPYTNQVVYLEDGDLALATEGGLTVWQKGVEVHRPLQQVTWSADQMSKGGYDHYMLKEIYEQPDAVRETLAEYLPGPEVGDSILTSKFLPMENPDAVLLLGCGTSFHSALLGEQILAQFLEVPVSARVASEFQKSPVQADRGLA